MNMYDFAAKMEHDAEHLFRDLAAKATTPGVRNIFNMLADDEKRDEKTIAVLRRKFGNHQGKETFLPEIKTVYEDIREHLDDIELSSDQREDYQLALDIEKKGLQFYKEQLGRIGNDEAQHLLKCITLQEQYHIKTLENIIEIFDRDKWWVENAEFTPQMSDYI